MVYGHPNSEQKSSALVTIHALFRTLIQLFCWLKIGSKQGMYGHKGLAYDKCPLEFLCLVDIQSGIAKGALNLGN